MTKIQSEQYKKLSRLFIHDSAEKELFKALELFYRTLIISIIAEFDEDNVIDEDEDLAPLCEDILSMPVYDVINIYFMEEYIIKQKLIENFKSETNFIWN